MEILENNGLFKRLGLIQQITLNLKINGNDFRKWFAEYVGDETNFFGVSNHKKSLHGEIETKSFKIYKPTKMTNNNSFACGQGSYAENGELLEVNLVVFIPMMTFIIFYLVVTLIAIITITALANHRVPILIVVSIYSFIGFFYLKIFWSFRRSVNELLDDIKREFSF